MPSNTRSMHEGVIHALKNKYSSRMIQIIIKAIDAQRNVQNINILYEIELLTSSWEYVTKSTVRICLAKKEYGIDKANTNNVYRVNPIFFVGEVKFPSPPDFC